MLKEKCTTALDVIKVVEKSKWSEDKISLLHLYSSLVRSKLDYGWIVDESATTSYSKTLNAIHHKGIGLCLGAVQTYSVDSLYVEVNEPTLDLRTLNLTLQHISKYR